MDVRSVRFLPFLYEPEPEDESSPVGRWDVWNSAGADADDDDDWCDV
jgi:hypothetical protein